MGCNNICPAACEIKYKIFLETLALYKIKGDYLIVEPKYSVYNIFSSIARRYDTLNTVLSFNVDKIWRKKTIKICNLKKEDRVLDLCCGTGQMLNYICKEVGKDAEVLGLDFNKEMIDVGYERLSQTLKGYKYKLVQGDVLELPFEDNSFNCVTIAFGLRNAPDKTKALQEMYRVAKPGGKVVCLELSNPELPVFKAFYALYFNNLLPIIGLLGTGDKAAYFYLRDSVKAFMSKKELKNIYERIGFKDAGYVSLTCGIASIHYGVKPL
jgi:demethylmenaquinone methyltransferase / 2-methoxy-6-polyprenyl-1,4-benzoquinol methylase